MNGETATPHGTLGRYQRHGCRCDECRAANTASTREYRRRNRAKVLGYQKQQRDVMIACTQWVRVHRPDVYGAILGDARRKRKAASS